MSIPINTPQATEVIPLVPEDITGQWLSEVLGQKVKTFEFTKKVLQATASKLHITVTYEKTWSHNESTKLLPTRLCIKGGFNQDLIKAFGHTGLVAIYQREAEFFAQVAPKIKGMDLLKCYGTSVSENQGIVVLDDLETTGMTFGEPTEAWPAERVCQGVEQLAALHASTWNDKAQDYPWLVNQYDQTIMALCGMWDQHMAAEGRPPHPAGWNEQRITAAFQKVFDARNTDTSLPHCLVHGDPHCGNTFLDKGAPRFLDWQLIHLGSPFHDIAYFVIGAMTVQDRRESEMDILKHYLASLEKAGGPRIAFEVAFTEYRKYMLSGIGWMLTPYSMQPQERVLIMGVRYSSAIVDHNVLELVESL